MHDFCYDKCFICGKAQKKNCGLGSHLSKTHKISFEDYILKFKYDNIIPLCACGCGEEVGFFRSDFREFKHGHWIRVNDIQNEKVIEKRKATCQEKYGGQSPASSKIVREKMKNTCLLRYGVEYALQNKDSLCKMQNTNLERYGCIYALQNLDIRKDIEETNLQRYGVKNVFSCEEIKEKIKITNLKKYGVEYCTQNIDIANKISITKRLTLEEISMLASSKGYIVNFEYNIYTDNRQNLSFLCVKHNKLFDTCIFNMQQDNTHQCPSCKQIGVSRIENSIVDFLKKECGIINISQNSRQVICPREVDIYLPDYKIAIEYHGLYWHSMAFDKFFNKKLHFEKFIECQKVNVKLFQFFEDEWRDKQDICRSMLKNALFLSNIQIGARECEIKEDIVLKNSFLNENHLQGNTKSIKNFALVYNNETVMLISLRRPFTQQSVKCIEIARVAVKKYHNISGGFSRLLQKVIEWAKINNYVKILTYSDCRYSSGNVYQLNGFQQMYHTGINYFYTDLHVRFNRFQFRAQNDKSEKEIAEENKVYKIYGAGNYMWELVII